MSSAKGYDEIAKWRHDLLRAIRIYPNPDLASALETADANDLEWLLERMSEQEAETPHHVKDEDRLGEIQAHARHYRTIVAQALGHKRTLRTRSRERRIETRANLSLVLSAVSLVFSLVMLITKL